MHILPKLTEAIQKDIQMVWLFVCFLDYFLYDVFIISKAIISLTAFSSPQILSRTFGLLLTCFIWNVRFILRLAQDLKFDIGHFPRHHVVHRLMERKRLLANVLTIRPEKKSINLEELHESRIYPDIPLCTCMHLDGV